jgi:hypothetical protein
MLGKRFVTPASARKADSQTPAVKTYKYCMLHDNDFGFLFCLQGFCTERAVACAYGCKLRTSKGARNGTATLRMSQIAVDATV